MPLKIHALDASVINKIAAGEIVISPVNALKEMMENSIDAEATMIDILVKEGGVKLLQITDNGTGINKDDLGILCERFTTSKLRTFDDLSSIATFGFRGEALASISHISRVTVITKTKNDKCAWKAMYSEGKMLGDPQPVAGKNGTIIAVEDLFYNIPSRLRALRSPGEEFNKILDVVGRYGINSENIGFSCKKFGDSQLALMVKSTLGIKDRIRIVFSSSVSSKILDFNMSVSESLKDFGLISAKGYISDLDYNSKKVIQPVFFINGRLVSCEPLKRSLNQVFSSFLPKGIKPFLYLSLYIKPANVDVNVHPTKREVRFLHEEEIIDNTAIQLQEKLASIDTSRTFKTSSMSYSQGAQVQSQATQSQTQSGSPIFSKVRRQENKLIRTDPSQTKITKYLRTSEFEPSQYLLDTKNKRVRDDSTEESNDTAIHERLDAELEGSETTLVPGSNSYPSRRETPSVLRPRKIINLTSIKELRVRVDEQSHSELTNIFANLTYVGIVDGSRRLGSIQCDLKLFLVDYGAICNELFYQIGLTGFANFGKIHLFDDDRNAEGLKISELLEHIDNLSEETMVKIITQLQSMADMLDEYFSIEIECSSAWREAKIMSIPILLKDYAPPLSKLPFFVYRIGTKVKWDDEKECLDGILRQIALFYIPAMIERVGEDDSEALKEKYATEMTQLANILDHVIFPAIKLRLLAPRNLLKDVVEVANLPGLYKVFERC